MAAAPARVAADDALHGEAVTYRTEGMAMQEHGDAHGAMAMLQKAIHLDPRYAAPHNDLGVVYESLGKLGDAEREYQAALAIDSGYVRAHANLALLYEAQGRRDQAAFHWLQRYRMGLSDDPWTATARNHLIALGYLEPPAVPAAPRGDASPGKPAAPQPTAPPSSAPTRSPQERAMRDRLGHYDLLLREFEAATDSDAAVWSHRPYSTTTGTQSHK